MGIMNSSGGKGSNVRPMSISQEKFDSNFDNIDWGNKSNKDNIQTKDAYIEINENATKLEKLLAGVPEDLYNNSLWVKEMCKEANAALLFIKEVAETKVVAYESSRNGFICKS